MTLAWAAVGWALGLALAPIVNLPVWNWLVQASAAAACALVFRKHPGYPRWFVAIALIYLGAARAQVALPRPDDSTVAAYNDLPVRLEVRGVVVEPPALQGRTIRVRMEAEAVSRQDAKAWRDVRGWLLLQTNEPVELHYGDRVQATGWLVSPLNTPDFPQADLLAREGVFSVLRAVHVDRLAEGQAHPLLGFLYLVRNRSLQVFASTLPPEEAALVSGVVLGADESMPLHLRQIFAQTGTTHILAVSGFNVALVAGTVTAVFGRWLGARRGAWASAAAIATYTLLVGAEPSAVRAALMAGLALLARRLGRQGNAVTALAATGILMTGLTPSLITDIGFQLSFAATIGLVFFAEPLEILVLNAASGAGPQRPSRPVVALLREVVLLTLAAQLATLPLLAYHFGRVPVAALPANFLILPVQPALMSLGGLTAILGMVWLPAGQVVAWLAWPFAAFTLRVVEVAAQLPGASLSLGPVSPWSVLASYILLAGGMVLWSRAKLRAAGLLSTLSSWAGVVALAVVTTFIWKAGLDAPDGYLHATLFPSGDVLIQSPTGRFVLVRPAEPGVLPSGDLGRRVPLTSNPLDWILLPTADSADAYLAGRPDDRFLPRGILYHGSAPRISAPTGAVRLPDLHSAQVGAGLELGAGARLEILALSDQGATLRLSLGRARVLVLAGSGLDSVGAADLAGASAILSDSLTRLGPVPSGLSPWMMAAGGGTLVSTPRESSAPFVYAAARFGWIDLRTDGEHLWVEVEIEVP